ncbi:MAG: hypothetical protein IJF27_08070 [Oscillospiraceae bacterium]|nr:hypothetical protein [Oscillospiraceae bacterium]
MTKRLIALLLSVLMVLTFTACGFTPAAEDSSAMVADENTDMGDYPGFGITAEVFTEEFNRLSKELQEDDRDRTQLFDYTPSTASHSGIDFYITSAAIGAGDVFAEKKLMANIFFDGSGELFELEYTISKFTSESKENKVQEELDNRFYSFRQAVLYTATVLDPDNAQAVFEAFTDMDTAVTLELGGITYKYTPEGSMPRLTIYPTASGSVSNSAAGQLMFLQADEYGETTLTDAELEQIAEFAGYLVSATASPSYNMYLPFDGTPDELTLISIVHTLMDTHAESYGITIDTKSDYTAVAGETLLKMANDIFVVQYENLDSIWLRYFEPGDDGSFELLTPKGDVTPSSTEVELIGTVDDDRFNTATFELSFAYNDAEDILGTIVVSRNPASPYGFSVYSLSFTN